MSCPIRKTIFEHAEKLGIIDENNNTIKSIAETQEYIQTLNDYAKETFGIDGDVVITQQVKNNAGIFIKLDLNPFYEARIDFIKSLTDLDVVFAENPAQSEMLEQQGYTYIGNKESDFGSLPAYYHFNMGESEAENAFNTGESMGESFVELRNYKKLQIEKLKVIIRQLNQEQLRPGADRRALRTKAATYANFKKELEEQVALLEDELKDNMYQAVEQDVDRLIEDLKKINEFTLKDIKDRRDFIWEFVHGTKFESQTPSDRFEGLPEDASLSRIKSKLDTLRDSYNSSIDNFIQRSIEEDVMFKTLKSNIKGDVTKTKAEIEEILKNLFTATNDITYMDKYTLGINQSFAWDTLYPQLMSSSLEYEEHKEKTVATRLKNRLKEVVGNVKDIEFVKERDENGDLTGDILDVYTKAWSNMQLSLSKIAQRYRFQSKPNKKREAYAQFINTVKANADFIDVRKLRSVYENYRFEEGFNKYFKFSEAEMDAYEQELINKIGVHKFEALVQTAIMQVENYLEAKQNPSNLGKTSYIESLNILAFSDAINDPSNRDGSIYYTEKGTGNTYATRFSDLESLVYIPKETVITDYDAASGSMTTADSGFYNKDFKNLTDHQKEILAAYREAATYVNHTYNLHKFDVLTFPKVMQEFKEQLALNFKNKKYSKIASDFFQEYKKYFYETGRFSVPGKKVKENYQDSSESQIANKAKMYIIKGMSSEEAYRKAKQEILSMYSQDTLRDMEAMLDLSAHQRARENAEPIIASYMEAFKQIKAGKGEQSRERRRAYEKVQNWIDRKIYGEEDKERGSGSVIDKSWLSSPKVQEAFKALGTLPVFKNLVNEKTPKLLNEVEKDLYNELVGLREEGYKGDKFSFTFNDVKYITDVVTMKDRNGNDLGQKQTFYATDQGGRTKVSKQEFDEKFQQWVESRIADLGLDLTTSGFIQGMMKTTILKGLGFNFISGLFNRLEGKNSLLIMDKTGNYWTQGNAEKANSHMNLFNTFKIAKKFIPNSMQGKHSQVKSIKNYLELLDVIQDKKNVFESNAESSKYDFGLSIFSLSVDNPEVKNQGTIALAIAMDHKVTIKSGPAAGTKVSLYSEDGQFIPFKLEGEQLVLKDEFKDPANGINDIFDFLGTDEMFQLKQKTRQAISKSQGNYDPNDTMYMTRNILGKAVSTFTKWRYEHIMQRFSPGKGYDLTFGKKRAKGRYVHLMDSSGALVAAGGVAAGITFGFGLPIVGGMAAVGLTKYAVRKFFKDTYAGEIERESSFVAEYAAMLASVIIETLNYPLRLVNVNGKYKIEKLPFTGYKPFEKAVNNNQMTEEQANNIAACARELAMMLVWLNILLAFKALTWDDDDDKESNRRRFHNFGDNQINRIINSMLAYSNPMYMWKDTSRLAVLDQIFKTLEMMTIIAGNEQAIKKFPKNLLDATPLPRVLYGTVPFQDPVQFDNMPSEKWNYSVWTDHLIRSFGDKAKFDKYRADKKEEIIKELEAQGLEGEDFDKALRRRLRKERLTKAQDMEYDEVIDELESGQSIEEIKKARKATKAERRSRVEELKSQGLSGPEIAEQMAEEFRGR